MAEKDNKPKAGAGQKSWAEQTKETIQNQANEIAELKKQLEDKSKSPVEAKPSISSSGNESDLLQRISQLEGMVKMAMLNARGAVKASDGKPLGWDKHPGHDDIQEKFVTFSARGVFYVISSYKKNNVLYIAPFKPIAFQFSGSDRRRVGKEEDIINYCVYSTNITAEIEFLRNHPLFGVEFSENLNEMLSQDAKFISRITSIISKFKSVSNEVLIPMAQQAKLNTARLSREDMIMELATREVKKEMAEETERTKASLVRAATGMHNMMLHNEGAE